jgi:hypothetical protein
MLYAPMPLHLGRPALVFFLSFGLKVNHHTRTGFSQFSVVHKSLLSSHRPTLPVLVFLHFSHARQEVLCIHMLYVP